MHDQILLDIFNSLGSLQLQAFEFFQALSNGNKETTWELWSKYYIPNILQLVAIIMGIWMVRHQIEKQHISNLESQNEKIRTDLKLQLRQEIETTIDKLNSLTAIARNFPSSLAMSLIAPKADIKFGRQPRPIPQRLPAFNERNAEIQNECVKLIVAIEKYEIVAPQLKVFQTAVNVFHCDFRQVFLDYMNELLKILPFDTSDEQRLKTGIAVFMQPLPTAEQEEKLRQLGETYSAILDDLGGWLMDFRTEIQTITLGKLFPENKASIRQPIDPDCIVIKTDPESISKVISHFESRTQWGREKKEIEEQVKKKYRKKTS